MRNVSHRSPIAAIKAVVDEWRKSRRWSREAVVEEIVEAHERIGAVRRVRVEFSENHHGEHTRQKTNADRVYRWLDDSVSERNLLSTNMLPSLLAALPVAARVALANEILAPAGLTTRVIESGEGDDVNAQELIRSIVRVNHRTESAAADLLDGIDPGELPRLHNSLIDEISVKTEMAGRVVAAMCKRGEAAPANPTKES
ncbi:hypothetical protein [Paraburkholderia unamae]|uniref:Bacterial toxin YdaT domain-containing protein n=1 Tax=Paraburkholderia unamae TaxID=219649 RepID=A0ABX5KXJ0_9BURK|nr:hypothetical protein [Paraburkholderia unamae]PVX86449.1 hypothetical protein C7402_102285 [Paraburkholderia unamae]